ncbi:non-canonical purine NTP pyrophosphatase [Candidatus Daviesbacteria bacterium]|nr:non-canonical purine NTP pyrophosphatase [Candidatus Daviesbacteria bacterium]
MKSITFVTGNKDKFNDLTHYIDFPIEHYDLDVTEIQSLNVEEIVEHKAKSAFSHLGQPVLIEDTSLIFNALGKLPGPLIKWFLKEVGNEGLCKLLNGLDDRTAIAEFCFGLYDGTSLELFTHKVEGYIAQKPQGTSGFGWDPIFIPKNSNKTWAQMLDEGQVEIRKEIVNKVSERLRENGL